MVVTNAAATFPKRDFQNPVELVLDAPVAAHCAGTGPSRAVEGGDVVPVFATELVADMMYGQNPDDALEFDPLLGGWLECEDPWRAKSAGLRSGHDRRRFPRGGSFVRR